MLLLGLVGPRSSARADLFFCEDDPIVSINNTNVSIMAGIAQEGLHNISGAALIVVVVPMDVDARLISVDSAFFPERVVLLPANRAEQLAALLGVPGFAPRFSAGGRTVRVFATIPTVPGGYTTQLRLGATGEVVEGVSNTVMELDFSAPKGGAR